MFFHQKYFLDLFNNNLSSNVAGFNTKIIVVVVKKLATGTFLQLLSFVFVNNGKFLAPWELFESNVTSFDNISIIFNTFPLDTSRKLNEKLSKWAKLNPKEFELLFDIYWRFFVCFPRKNLQIFFFFYFRLLTFGSHTCRR